MSTPGLTEKVSIIGDILQTAFHEDASAEAGINALIARLDALPSKLRTSKGKAHETEAGRRLA